MHKNIYVMVGPAAQGKSTLAKKIIREVYKDKYPDDWFDRAGWKYLNADLIREELYGDPSIQGNGKEVFGILFDRYTQRLKDDFTELIVIDNTSLTFELRHRYYELANTICPMFQHSFDYTLVFFNRGLGWSLEKDQLRDRHVGEEVIRCQFQRYQQATLKEMVYAKIMEIK